jgi:hypothetical protein
VDALTTATETIEREVAGKVDEQTLLMAAKINALLVGYHFHWCESGYRTEATEMLWHLPIINPLTGRKSRTYTQAGKVDGIVTMNGQRFLLEHKTTSDDISDPNAPYWRRLAIDCQVSMYGLAMWQSGLKLDGTVYDVIRKPTIRPKEIPKGSAKKPDAENIGTLIEIEKFGTYFGGGVPQETLDAIRNGWLTREDALLFRHRLVDDVVARPANYFQRRIVPRMSDDLVEWSEELWDLAQEMNSATVKNRHYRNSEACMAYSRPCEYLALCSGHDTPESENWRTSDGVHQELGVEFGSSVITCSRIKCFQTCRRKHFWRYVKNLRKQQEDEAEALHFGRLLHIGLESWFNCFKEGESHVDCNQLAASGVASSADHDDREESSVACGDPWG